MSEDPRHTSPGHAEAGGETVLPGALILGLGNDLVSDDGFGPAVAELCRWRFHDETRIRVESASVAGFHLLDLLAGHERVLILDAVQTGRYPAGTLLEWPIGEASRARTLGGSHQMDLLTTLALGRSVGWELPGTITLVVVEAEDLLTIREELTPAVRGSVKKAVRLAAEWLDQTGAFAPGIRRDDAQARTLS